MYPGVGEYRLDKNEKVSDDLFATVDNVTTTYRMIFLNKITEEADEVWESLYNEVYPKYEKVVLKDDIIYWEKLKNKKKKYESLYQKLKEWSQTVNIDEDWFMDKSLDVMEYWNEVGGSNFQDMIKDMEFPLSEESFLNKKGKPVANWAVTDLNYYIKPEKKTIELPSYTWHPLVYTKERFKKLIMEKIEEIIDEEMDRICELMEVASSLRSLGYRVPPGFCRRVYPGSGER